MNNQSAFNLLKQKLESIGEIEAGLLTGGFLSIESEHIMFSHKTNSGSCTNGNDCQQSNNIAHCNNAVGSCRGSANAGACELV
ncbi:MAG: hypothetical protein AAFP89_05690 [Bacteroidota bacterium]